MVEHWFPFWVWLDIWTATEVAREHCADQTAKKMRRSLAEVPRMGDVSRWTVTPLIARGWLKEAQETPSDTPR
jgi:hypothetical protein